jgi:hypothetical protein
VSKEVGKAEVDFRLTVDLSTFTVEMGKREDLPTHMQHEIWTDGVVLFGEMSALATMRPDGLALWHVVRFTLKDASPAERNRLSRRLHGMGARTGVLRPPAYPLGRGALFVPADQARAVADVLDEAGAMYDMTPVWREF